MLAQHPDEIPFQFFVKADAFEKADVRGQEYRIGGFVSTEHEDQQREVLLQNGLDFGPFLEKGWFNDNHSKSVTDALGYPLYAERRSTPDGKLGTWVEGYLLKGYHKAEDVWQQYHALKDAGFPRRIGFSVEGGIQRRQGADGRTVSKAVVRHVAITHCPVNTHAQLNALAKALMAGGDVARPSGGPAPGNAFALRTESLESAPADKKKKRKRRLSKSQAITRLLDRGYSVAAAERVWNITINRRDR